MKFNQTLRFSTAVLAAAAIAGSAHAQLLDDDFDNGNIATGGTNGGFQLTENAVGSTGNSASESGTVGTVTTGGANNNAGLYSVNSIDLGNQIGFSATFDVANAPNGFFSNGMMLGITEDATTFYRAGGTQNFGFIFGSANFGAGADDLYLVSNDSGGGVIQATILENLDLASVADGFTASFTIWKDNTFRYEVTGLTGTGSSTGSGTLSGGVNYASQFDSADHAFGSLQSGSGGGQINRVLGLDRVTIDAPSILPTETINVSDLTTTTVLNTVTPGVAGTHVARGRATTTQDDLQVANFMNFDVSMLTASDVNAADFKAEFKADMVDVLNNVYDAAVFLGRNDSGTWDASGSNNPLHDWGFIDETATPAAEDVVVLVDNVRSYTDANGDINNATAFTADVTDIVKGWVNGTNPNQGLVLYMQNIFQAGGFENAEIVITPEPSSLALLGLGGLLIARRRR